MSDHNFSEILLLVEQHGLHLVCFLLKFHLKSITLHCPEKQCLQLFDHFFVVRRSIYSLQITVVNVCHCVYSPKLPKPSSTVLPFTLTVITNISPNFYLNVLQFGIHIFKCLLVIVSNILLGSFRKFTVFSLSYEKTLLNTAENLNENISTRPNITKIQKLPRHQNSKKFQNKKLNSLRIITNI